MHLIPLLLILHLLPCNLLAANLAQEQRLSEALLGQELQGDAQWLTTEDVRFLAILEKSHANERLGGAILLHDVGDHADGAGVIGPLRRYLALRGWHTLSLQLPRPSHPLTQAGRAEATELALARLQAAVEFFNTHNTAPLVLVGHGLGAEMALAYLAADPENDALALVAIGLAANEGSDADPVIQTITRLQRPMLDIFGDRDHPEVLASAQARLGAAKRNQREDYRQDRVMGADHHFNGLQTSLQQRVASWLRRVAKNKKNNPR
jgi:dienelactone hydrolase